jgi:hypothetical protein
LFQSLETAGDYINNNKTIVVPVKEKNKVLVNLQMIFNVNMQVESKNPSKDNESASNYSAFQGSASPSKRGIQKLKIKK